MNSCLQSGDIGISLKKACILGSLYCFYFIVVNCKILPLVNPMFSNLYFSRNWKDLILNWRINLQVMAMSKRFTLQEAADFLGIDQSEVEDLIAEGKISFDVADDQYRIAEDPLRRIRVERIKNLVPNSKYEKSLVNDRDFIDYISDYIHFEISDLSVRIEELNKKDSIDSNKAFKIVNADLDEIKKAVLPLAEMKLNQEAQKRLLEIMEKSVDKVVAGYMDKAGDDKQGGLKEKDLQVLTDSVNKVLEEKLSQQNKIIDSFKAFEKKTGDDLSKILKHLDSFKKSGIKNVDNHIKELIGKVNHDVVKKMDALTKDRAELGKIFEKLEDLGELKPGEESKEVDLSGVKEALENLQTGQKKARKIMIDLNVNLQKSLVSKMEDIKVLQGDAPKLLEDFNKVIPSLKEISTEKMGDLSGLISAVKDLKDNLKVEGQEKVVEKLDELKNLIQRIQSEKVEIPAPVDEKFKETTDSIEQLISKISGEQYKTISDKLETIGGSLENIKNNLSAPLGEQFKESANSIEQLVKMGGNQQKAISEKLDSVSFSLETLDNITDRLQTIENTFPELSDIIEERFGNIDRAIVRVQKLQDDIKLLTEKADNMDTGVLDVKLAKIQEFLDSYAERFDVKANIETFKNEVNSNLSEFKTNQESFQKIIVNLTRTNNTFVEEKLEHLDRLNELVLMKDSIDEVAEQMHTFEAIMADINQLVDERLQVLHDIQQNLSTFAGKFDGEEAQSRLFEKVDEIRSIIDLFQDRFSMESLLAHIKNIIEKESIELKQNQEAAQKILVNLNVNSQKWMLEKLEEVNVKINLIEELKDKTIEIRKALPDVSGDLKKKLDQMGEFSSQLQDLEVTSSLQDTLSKIQNAIDSETRTFRTSIESAQKMIVNLSNANQRLLMEKLDSVGLSGESFTEIARKNQEILAEVLNQVHPGDISQMMDNLIAALQDLKNNLSTDGLLKKVNELIDRQGNKITESQEKIAKSLSNVAKANYGKLHNRVEKLIAGLSELRSFVEPEAIVSSLGEVIIEGNEILKENQVELLKLEMKNHKDLLEELKRIQVLKSGISSAGSTGDLIPVLENLLNDSLSNFKNDLDGAHKVLVNLNINLQKQLVAKIQDLLNQQNRTMQVKIDSESLVDTLVYLMDEKLNDLRENQESLLSINLNTQKTLLEKISQISLTETGESISDGLHSLLPLIEKILVDKLQTVVQSHEKAQQALENLNAENKDLLVSKLDKLNSEVKNVSAGDINSYLPAIREALEDTFTYLNQLRSDIESLKKNIQLQDPSFLGEKFEEIREFLTSPDTVIEGIPRIEKALKDSISSQRKTLDEVNKKLEVLYDAMRRMYEEQGDSESIGKVQKLFSKKLEETQQLEYQLVQSFQEMQEIFNQGYSVGGESYVQEIVKALEETRSDQEKISLKIEQLSSMLQKSQGITPPADTRPLPDIKIVDQMRKENSRMRQLTEKLKRENVDLNNQLKQVYSRGGIDTARLDQLQNAMGEKDRLLEECYKEKVKLKDDLEKEKRDKYEIIQKYETEKKELIDTLALERIQREKDRAELELLRAESRKKKWW